MDGKKKFPLYAIDCDSTVDFSGEIIDWQEKRKERDTKRFMVKREFEEVEEVEEEEEKEEEEEEGDDSGSETSAYGEDFAFGGESSTYEEEDFAFGGECAFTED